MPTRLKKIPDRLKGVKKGSYVENTRTGIIANVAWPVDIKSGVVHVSYVDPGTLERVVRTSWDIRYVNGRDIGRHG